MNWLMWRLYRKLFLLTGIGVVVFAAILIIVGHDTARAYAHYHDSSQGFYVGAMASDLPIFSIALPLLFGMFWGAPLIAREYSENTTKLAWTQSVTRRKWLYMKFGWMAAVAAVYGMTISIAVSLCTRTANMLNYDRFQPVHFATQGIVPVILSIFAIALGTFVGTWRRQVLSAVAITGALYIGTVAVISTYARPHYMTPITTGASFFVDPNPLKPNEATIAVPKYGTVWVIKRTYRTVSSDCQVYQGNKECSYDNETDKRTYQPANRYWIFQAIESGIYLTLSCLLVIGSYRLIMHRDV